MVVLVILAVLLLASAGVLAALPWAVVLKWRKSWQGPLGFQTCFSVKGLPFQMALGSRRWRCQWGSCHWSRAIAPKSDSIRQAVLYSRWLRPLVPAIRVARWHLDIEVGFGNPDLTGRYWGTIAALPAAIATHIRPSFEREGIRSRGNVMLRARPLLLLGYWLQWRWRRSPVRWN
jgi:hypothetical protein